MQHRTICNLINNNGITHTEQTHVHFYIGKNEIRISLNLVIFGTSKIACLTESLTVPFIFFVSIPKMLLLWYMVVINTSFGIIKNPTAMLTRINYKNLIYNRTSGDELICFTVKVCEGKFYCISCTVNEKTRSNLLASFNFTIAL